MKAVKFVCCLALALFVLSQSIVAQEVDALPEWNGVVKTGGQLNLDRALRNQTDCTFSLSPSQVFWDRFGGTFSVEVTTGTNCVYSPFSNSSWIVVSGHPRNGSGTVRYTVQANGAFSSRTGAINIGGAVLTVNQQGIAIGLVFGRDLDFDGDGRTDYSAIQNSGGAMVWHNYRSFTGYAATNFGSFASDIPVPNEYDGDGKTDVAVWRSSSGTFYVLRSLTNTLQAFQFGQAGDNPVVSQDFDGDRKADFAVTRAVGGNLIWYVFGSASGFRAAQFGAAGDKPLRGDFDGDGRADYAVYRPANASPANTFFVRHSSTGAVIGVTFGDSMIDKLVPGDYDGDDKTDFAVWRPANGVWYYTRSAGGGLNAIHLGVPGDLPVPGDYDGDRKTDFAVWRPNASQAGTGVFYVRESASGYSISVFGWGNSQMKIPANLLLPD